ncbi:hypothetical protein AK812_SmicGene44894, partial [Symbiodinium microadriaticum]
ALQGKAAKGLHRALFFIFCGRRISPRWMLPAGRKSIATMTHVSRRWVLRLLSKSSEAARAVLLPGSDDNPEAVFYSFCVPG